MSPSPSIYSLSDHIGEKSESIPVPKETESSVLNSSIGGFLLSMMKLEVIQLLHIWLRGISDQCQDFDWHLLAVGSDRESPA